MRPRAPVFGLRLSICLFIAGLVSTEGCGPPEPTLIGRGRRIREVELNGVTRFSKGEVLDYLRLGETSILPLFPNYPFDEALLAADMRRLEALYRAHGYYEARVVKAQPEAIDDDKMKVRLRIEVEEGRPTRVEAIRFLWPADAPFDAAARQAIEKQAALEPGAPFEVPRLNESIGNLRQALQLRGHPLGFVRGQADVQTDARQAGVVLQLHPGPHALIEQISFEGLVSVPEYMVRREVRFALGADYSPAVVRQVEEAVKAMRVFRWVATVPPTTVDNGRLHLVIRVSEADPQTVRLGLQLGFEATRWEELVTARYTHTNLFGHLTRLDLDMVVGWAELPDPFDANQHGPVLAFGPTFTKKGLVEDMLVWTLAPAWEMDVREGYQFHSPSNRFGVARWLFGRLHARLTHNLRYVDFFGLVDSFDANTSVLGRDFQDPFLLSYLEAQADLFFTDSLVTPHNGVVFEALYDLAGSFLQGDYDFHKLVGGVRAYWKALSRLQVAARWSTGVILPYGPQAGAPFNLKFYLGGANTLRGWGSQRLSPRLEECDDAGEACSSIPVGGYTLVQGNLELRLAVGGDFHLVGFFDMGDVQALEREIKVDEWNYSAGPGLRFDSPVGLFRLDVGFRLNDPGIYPDEPMWAVYFGLGETF